jgi:hypothetical protein
MTEPRRLIETCEAPLERAILGAGFSVKASPLARERTLEALCGVGPVSSGVISFFPQRKRRMLLAALSLSTLAAAMPLGYFVWQTTHTTLRQDTVDQTVVTAPVVETTKSERSFTSKPESSTPDEGVAAPVDGDKSLVTTEQSKRRSGATESASSKPVEPNLLTAELSALDAARAKLHAADPNGALQLLDAYQRDFPRPRLALEAEVLRIFAYDKAGQKQLAKKRAEAFVVKYPKGVLSARVRRYLEQ